MISLNAAGFEARRSRSGVWHVRNEGVSGAGRNIKEAILDCYITLRANGSVSESASAFEARALRVLGRAS